MKFKSILIGILIGVLIFNTSSLKVSAEFSNYYGDKPVFVEVSTDWCFACNLLKPTIQELEKQYGSEVEFIRLNGSNEETIKQAEQLASEYGVADFFNKRKAYPTVGIFSTSGKLEKEIVGANAKEAYTTVLDGLIGVALATKPPSRPEEPKPIEVVGGRPEEPDDLSNRPAVPNFLDRPNEVISSGRPPELTFWVVGQQIPAYAYAQYLVLPKCSGSNNTVCSNAVNAASPSNTQNQAAPVFKPWDPNATRNEKGFDAIVKKG